MTYSHADYEALLERKGKETIRDQRPLLALAEQASVKAEHLTGDPNWDFFLSFAQAEIEFAEGQIEVFLGKLGDGVTVSHDELMVLKIAKRECEGRIAAWRRMMTLPKSLMAGGEQARSLLERIGDES